MGSGFDTNAILYALVPILYTLYSILDYTKTKTKTNANTNANAHPSANPKLTLILIPILIY